MNTRARLEEAIRLHDSGRAEEAERIYAEVLEVEPRNDTALYLYGVVAYQNQNPILALERIDQAIRLSPKVPFYYYYKGLALYDLDRIDEAIAAYKHGIKLRKDLYQFYEALGKIMWELERFKESVKFCRSAIKLNPDNEMNYNYLGLSLTNLGRMDEAVDALKQAIRLKGNYCEAHNNLANVYHHMGRWEDAVSAYLRALEIEPNLPQTLSNLGNCYRKQGKLEEAIRYLEQAADSDPQNYAPFMNLAIAYQSGGLIDRASEQYKKAQALNPRETNIYSNILFGLNYQYDLDRETIFKEHLKWNEQFNAMIIRNENVFSETKDSARRLRIGYVSADFKSHSVSFFITPVLRNHDSDHFSVYCYSNVRSPDQRTEEIKRCKVRWREINGMSESEFQLMVARDKIDILVDLSGHSQDNRLLAFAGRIAPVQVSWLGYPNTTGVQEMDYRLSDEITEPTGDADRYSSEKIVRLPNGFHCYEALPDCPDVVEAPCMQNGFVTFGSFNHLPKVNEEVVRIWAQVLKAVPDARLILKNISLCDDSTRKRYLDRFEREGVEPGRIEMLYWTATTQEHLQSYGKIDVALDPFPYNGTTTTCEALWMGVPVICLQGDRYASRVTSSLITRIGYPNWAASTLEDYVRNAVRMAQDFSALASVRSGLRDAMKRSPLCQAENFTRDLEAGFRQVWKECCGG